VPVSVLSKLFGDRQSKKVRALEPYVARIHAFLPELGELSDEELRDRTRLFRARLARGETLDDVLCEAFAVVRDACRRLCGRSWVVSGHQQEWAMVPYDVQLLGAVALHQGRITEMATGEGKTLVAVMAMYLNALDLSPAWTDAARTLWGDDPEAWTFEPLEGLPVGRGTHLVTVNDYLASRDAQWMGGVYEFLGLTVGCIQMEMTPDQRRAQYACDITYGTNSQFGFDYLRDNMAVTMAHRVQRGHHFVIVDEVDSVLVDEARTPLIISGPVPRSANRYKEYRDDVQNLARRQTVIVNQIVSDADEAWERGRHEDAALLYLKATKGAPKQKKLVRALQDPDRLREVQRTEGSMLRDKTLHTLEEGLLFSLDEKERSVALSDAGRKALSPSDPDFFLLTDIGDVISDIEADAAASEEEKVERRNRAYAEHARKAEALHNIDQLLRAYQLYEKDVEYVVQEGRVVIVDQFTGRLMPGRRFSDGLHEALEAKEGVEIQSETQTLATITIQNYFRMYDKLAGMTGTAETEADEFESIYGLEVVVVPTNVPVIRVDHDDRVYRTRREKYAAIVAEIERMHSVGQPVLVGTVSVDVSELLSRLLHARRIPHSVLNAKHHREEAEIVARAGQRGAVTIATNMAGRGTDIKLAPEILRVPGPGGEVAGGLFVIGTERHESRRIDRQLRGRSGRQGDPGGSRFHLSLEDDLFRLFASEKMIDFLKRSGGEKEGEPIEHPLLTKAIEKAQKRVEEYNFGIRKHLLEYDDVVNKQREVIYGRRLQALTGEGLREEVLDMIGAVASEILLEAVPDDTEPDDWNLDRAVALLGELSGVRIDLREIAEGSDNPAELRGGAADKLLEFYALKRQRIGEDLSTELEKRSVLGAIDAMWRDHLNGVDQLKSGIGLRAYGQRDPLVEFKKEAFGLFEEMLGRIDRLAVRQVLTLWPRGVGAGMPANAAVSGSARHPSSAPPRAAEPGGLPAVQAPPPEPAGGHTVVRSDPKVGRNDLCPCGSGRKYKKCCGR